MNKNTITALLITFLLLIPLNISATAQETNKQASKQAYHDTTTGIKFPGQLGSLSYIKKQEYPNPALGISVRYALGKDVKADIYIYNLHTKNIGNNKITSPVINQLAQAVDDVYTVQKQGLYEDVKPYPDTGKLKFNFKKIKDKHFTWTALTYRQKGPQETNRKTRRSFIYLTSKNNQFIKIRYTYMQSHGNIGHQVFHSFMKALAREL